MLGGSGSEPRGSSQGELICMEYVFVSLTGQDGRSLMDLPRQHPTVLEALESAARNTQYVLK